MDLLSESRFNAYNQLAVVTLMLILGFSIVDILKNMSKLKIADTRYEKIELGNHKYLIKHLTKGQNPLACSNVFDFVRNYEGKKNVILMLDDKSDNEEGVEVILWHYDADYEFLNDPNIERIIIIGPRSKDIYVRTLLAGIDSSKLFVFENQKEAYNYITMDKVETLFLLNDMYIEKEATELKEHIIETFKS
jgi:UDP-N-acetylmuramyl tripeptide synthase